MRPLSADRETGIKSTHKGSSSTSPQNPPAWISIKGGTPQGKISDTSKADDHINTHSSIDPTWISTKGGIPQSKTSDSSKTDGHIRTHGSTDSAWISTKGGISQGKASDISNADGHTKTHDSTDPSKTPIPFHPKPVIPSTTKAPASGTPSVPKDIPATIDYPDEFFDDDIEDEPENEIEETPLRPEPLLVEQPQSSLMDKNENSKKAFVSVPSNHKGKLNPSSSMWSSEKPTQDADSNGKSFHETTSEAVNTKTGSDSKSASHVDGAPSLSTKDHTPMRTFSPVPDMDYDNFGASNNPTNNDDSRKHNSRGFTRDRQTVYSGFSTVHKQIPYNNRPLTVQLMPQALPVLTSSAIIPEVVLENPVIGYYYGNHQPATVTYEYGIPMDVVVTN